MTVRRLRNIFAYYVLLTLLYQLLAPTLLGIVQSQERLVVREERRRKSLPPIPTAELLAVELQQLLRRVVPRELELRGVAGVAVSSTTSSGTQSKSHRSSTSSQAQKTPRGSCVPMVPEGTEEV